MTIHEKIDLFFDELLDGAVEKYRKTRRYELAKEKMNQMDSECESVFREDERDFAEKCFETILEVSGYQEEFVYRQGILDCVVILILIPKQYIDK